MICFIVPLVYWTINIFKCKKMLLKLKWVSSTVKIEHYSICTINLKVRPTHNSRIPCNTFDITYFLAELNHVHLQMRCWNLMTSIDQQKKWRQIQNVPLKPSTNNKNPVKRLSAKAHSPFHFTSNPCKYQELNFSENFHSINGWIHLLL